MTSTRRIFDGVRILDVTQYIAGPVATRLFVDLGAEVIKVELPPAGEGSRGFFLTEAERGSPVSMYFAAHNRGKKCVCVDFKKSEGAGILKDLAKCADVFIENYTPGVLKRYGLGYEEVARVNPNMVMCSISAYGQEGPYAGRPGNDVVAMASGGLLHMIGEPDGLPAYPASAIGDHLAAVNAFGAISAALFHRQRTGEGQYIDLALVDCVFNVHDSQLPLFSLTEGKFDAQRGGAQRTGTFPFGVFKGKDSYIGIGANDAQWSVLATHIGREELFSVPDFHGNSGRVQSAAALTHIIEEWLATFASDDEAVRFLADEIRIPAARVLSVGQFVSDPILGSRMVEKMPAPEGKQMTIARSPHKFSKTPPEIPGPAALLGEHTTEILSSLCGYSPERIAALMKSGLILAQPKP